MLLLHGSVRPRSFSRRVNEEAARILTRLGAEAGPLLPDDAGMAGRIAPTHGHCRKVLASKLSITMETAVVWRRSRKRLPDMASRDLEKRSGLAAHQQHPHGPAAEEREQDQQG